MSALLIARIAIVLAIAGAGFAAGWQLQSWRLGAQIGPLKAEVSRLQARSTILESANAQCAQSVKNQNQVVERLVAAQRKREQRAKIELALAADLRTAVEAEIAALRKRPAPSENDTCQATLEASRQILAEEVARRLK